jgi:hypothetical protein
MSRQYSIPTVLRMVPNCLLKAFFAQLGYDDPEFPWNRLGEREISPMIRWIGLLPRHAQRAVDGHFHQVFNLSCHAGVETLFEAAVTSLSGAGPRRRSSRRYSGADNRVLR